MGEVIYSPMTESALKFVFTDFSQLYWEKSFRFMTSPQFIFTCRDFSQHVWEKSFHCWEKSEKLGRSHLFYNDRECTKMYFYGLLPTYLGEVIPFHDFSQNIWEMSFKCWEKSENFGRSHFLANDRNYTKRHVILTSPKFFGRSHTFYLHLPNYLGEVIFLYDFSQLLWEMSLISWEMSCNCWEMSNCPQLTLVVINKSWEMS